MRRAAGLGLRLALLSTVILCASLAGSSAGSSPDPVVRWERVTLPPAEGTHRASFGEPGIAVGPSGTLVVNAARANDGYPTWWTSSDLGAHWGPGTDLDPSGAMTGDADAAFGSDGYIYALNLAFKSPPDQPTNPTIFVYASPDGRHFRGPARFPAPHGNDQPDRPWLLTDPHHPSHVYVSNSEGAGDVVLWTSTDHGATFSGPIPVTGTEHAASIELTSRPLFDAVDRDRIFLFYEASAPDEIAPPDSGEPLRDFPLTQLWIAESKDAGRSWSNRLVLDITDAFGASAAGGSLGHVLPASAIDESGTLYAAFSLRLGKNSETHIFVIHSADHGLHWSEPVRVDPGTLGSNVMPALVAAGTGRIDLAWYGSASSDFADPHSRWVEMFAQSLDALSAHPTFTTSRVSGVTHIGSVDASGNPGSTRYDWGLRDFQSVAVDAQGMAHLAWTDDTGPGVTVAARQVAGPSLRAPARPVVMNEKETKPAVRTERARRLPATGAGPGPDGLPLVVLAAVFRAWARRRA